VAFLNPNLPFLAAVPPAETFQSPFPSSFDSPKLAALDAYSEGSLAAAGASAWSSATQIALKLKGVHAGDLRSDWLARIVREDPGSGAFMGAFAAVSWPDSTSLAALEGAMVQTGFNLSEGLLTSVPVYGQILGAVVDVARWFHALFRRKPEVQRVLVPWAAYDKGLDEDLCRLVVFPEMQGFDWTRLFWPALRWETGFRMFVTDEGPETRAWGTFSSKGELLYTTNAPGGTAGGGLGFMPGTQKMADVVQLAIYGQAKGPNTRIDAVTSVGDFFPAAAQACTGLWEMVAKAGNPDMYKVRAGQLADAWSAYFSAMRESFAEEWQKRWSKGYTDGGAEELVSLGKLVSPFLMSDDSPINLEALNARYVWPGMTRGPGKWRDDPGDGRPRCAPKPYEYPEAGWVTDPSSQAGVVWPPDRCSVDSSSSMRKAVYRFLDEFAIVPSCERLKQAQHRALYRTEICAYVRPDDVGGLPRYGAFEDTSAPIGSFNGTFGEQLRERCLFAREQLLSHDLRFRVRLEDVDAIDPVFASQLRNAGVTEDSWKQAAMMRLSTPLGDAEDVPPSSGPKGGRPFRVGAPRQDDGGGAGLVLGGAAALAAFAFLSMR
jgi:hypothetical protein